MEPEHNNGLGPHGGFVAAHPNVVPIRPDSGTHAQRPPRPAAEPGEAFRLEALRLTEEAWAKGWGLTPAAARRDWMDAQPYAYKCLPLLMANQWGWIITSPTDLVVSWNGSRELSGLTVEIEPAYRCVIESQFGDGIVTFSPPWLFKTPPGWDLLLKGPSNTWKANCAPLEGIIETWWLNYTFTLNWKVVEPGTVRFRRGEPIGQLVPIPHETFRGSLAEEVPIESRPEAHAELTRWQVERTWRSGASETTHNLYRKADEIEGHLVRARVPVPLVTRPGDVSK